MTRLIATFFYVGLLPRAPGTWGSLAALPFGLLLALASDGPWALLGGCALVFALGWWATAQETKEGDPDPGEIVIDEVLGQWLALLPLALGMAVRVGDTGFDAAFNLLLAFGLFRIFDIMKPYPVSRFDAMGTPLGVMLDDVAAGLMAALCLGALSLAGGA